MEVKCTCNQCNQPLGFPGEMAGQTITCPHCQMETVLFIPPSPAASKSPAPKPEPPAQKQEPETIEARLEKFGDAFLMIGVVGMILFGVFASVLLSDSVPENGGNNLSAIYALVAAACSLLQGFVGRILFYALAEIIRLLRTISLQKLKS